MTEPSAICLSPAGHVFLGPDDPGEPALESRVALRIRTSFRHGHGAGLLHLGSAEGKGLAAANREGAAIGDEHLAEIFGIEMEAKASRPVGKPRRVVRKEAKKARRALRQPS